MLMANSFIYLLHYFSHVSCCVSRNEVNPYEVCMGVERLEREGGKQLLQKVKKLCVTEVTLRKQLKRVISLKWIVLKAAKKR